MVGPSLGGIKDLESHFRTPIPEPRGFDGEVVDIEAIPLDFHKENTVTNDLIFDDFEDEDYIDFDKILAAGSDDYMWVLTLVTFGIYVWLFGANKFDIWQIN